MDKKGKVRAYVLLSGGLDSLLAVCVLREQGIEVTGLTFVTPFFGPARAKASAEQLGIDLEVLDIGIEHLEMVKKPSRGYGKCMNPCIDCHVMMIRKAGELMQRSGFDLIATGEVLGERPMSQNRQSLDMVARMSGFAEFLLRPLSAKLLVPTRPELEGKVDRERLLEISGRSRKPQFELAKKYGIDKYENPAGGCLLTDPIFSQRLRELFSKKPDAGIGDVSLLRIGRHFRLSSGAKIVAGRNEKENDLLMKERDGVYASVTPTVAPGPFVLVLAPAGEADVEMAARICVSYTDNKGEEIELEVSDGAGKRRINVAPIDRKNFDPMRI